MKKIAFFDFDGTITTNDTLLEFIRFTKGNVHFIMGFLLHLPFLVAYKLKLISNQSAKEKMLKFFFYGTPVLVFQQQCASFTKNILPMLIRPKALSEMIKQKESGTLIVIVSASPENWIRTWAEVMEVQLIARRLEVKNDRITGKILGKNCHGKEKVRRIREIHTLSDYEVVYAYGDTRGDLPMLQLATHSFYKPFRNKTGSDNELQSED